VAVGKDAALGKHNALSTFPLPLRPRDLEKCFYRSLLRKNEGDISLERRKGVCRHNTRPTDGSARALNP